MAAPVDQRLQPYNPTQHKSPREFHHFLQLPQELRLYIWELALPCERFLKIRLVNASAPAEEDGHATRDSVILAGRKSVPKLLHVCKESQSAALKFYRVQIPCHYRLNAEDDDHEEAGAKGIFYFNPEFDILKIHPSRRTESFSDFVCGIKSRDSKKVGLLNLAMDINDLGCNALKRLNPADLKPDARSVFLDTIAALKQLFFMSVESAGRMYLGPLHGIPGVKGWEMHRSLPVEGSVPRFHRLDKDPRNIQEDLKKVYLGTSEPKKMIIQWRKLLQKWDVKPLPEVQHRFMLACEPQPEKTEIFNQETARSYILHEDKEWREGVDRWQQRLKKKTIERETPGFLQTVPKTAVGFWLFPVKALGVLPDDNQDVEELEQQLDRSSKRVVDMTEFRPELGLLEL